MGDADRKMKGTAGVTMFTPLVRTAAKPYTCDGCGECPISPGDTYMLSAARGPDGKFGRRRYCIRCILAIEVKKAFAKGMGVAVNPGDLKLSRLSSKFQKAWLTMCKGIRLSEQEGDTGGAHRWSVWFQKEMGIVGIGAPKTKIDQLAERMSGKKEKRKGLKAEAKELREELRRLKEGMKSLLMDLALWRDEAASRRLAYKIAATKGDEAAMAEADKGLVEALLAMQKVIEGGEAAE